MGVAAASLKYTMALPYRPRRLDHRAGLLPSLGIVRLCSNRRHQKPGIHFFNYQQDLNGYLCNINFRELWIWIKEHDVPGGKGKEQPLRNVSLLYNKKKKQSGDSLMEVIPKTTTKQTRILYLVLQVGQFLDLEPIDSQLRFSDAQVSRLENIVVLQQRLTSMVPTVLPQRR